MYIGHYAVGYAAKRAAASVSLGTLVMATLWCDLVWPFFVLMGWERVSIEPGITEFVPFDLEYMPYSHSLAATVLWGAAFGAIHYHFKKNKKAAVVLALCVLSHWILDFITHRPDMPISWWSETRVGLGLWHSSLATVLVEGAFFAACFYAFIRSFSLSWMGWLLLVLINAVYLGAILGVGPPDGQSAAYAGVAQWMFIALAYGSEKKHVR